MALPAILAAVGSLASGARGVAGIGAAFRGGRAAGGAVAGGLPPPPAGGGNQPPNQPPGGGGFMDALGKFAALSFNLQLAGQALSTLGKAVINLPAAPIHALSAAIGLIQAPAVAAVSALKGMVGSIGSLGSAMSDFVRLASPIHVVRFNLAMDDLMAVIGKIMIPVITASTAFVRAFADVIFRLSGPFQQLMSAFFDPITRILPQLVNAFAPLIDAFASLVELAAGAIAPLMEALVPLFANLAIGFTAVVGALTGVALTPVIVGIFGALVGGVAALAVTVGPLIAVFAGIGYAVQKLFKYLGLGSGSVAGSSVGAAVRPATIGSVEDYGRKAQQAAFSLGTAADPARDSAKTLAQIWDEIRTWPAQAAEWVAKLPLEIALAITGKAAKIAHDVGEKGREAGRWVGRRKDELDEAADDVRKWFRDL